MAGRYSIHVDLLSDELMEKLKTLVETAWGKSDPEMSISRFIRHLIRNEWDAHLLLIDPIKFTGKGNELKDLPSMDPENMKR